MFCYWGTVLHFVFREGCQKKNRKNCKLHSPSLSLVRKERRCCLRFGRENIWRQLFAFNCESFQTPRTRLFCFCSHCWCVSKNRWYMHHCMAWSQEAQLLENIFSNCYFEFLTTSHSLSRLIVTNVWQRREFLSNTRESAKAEARWPPNPLPYPQVHK